MKVNGKDSKIEKSQSAEQNKLICKTEIELKKRR
jgi:hypothetical protein